MRIIAKKLYYPRDRNGHNYAKKILSVLYEFKNYYVFFYIDCKSLSQHIHSI